MINHAYCLLVNRRLPDVSRPEFIFIPPDFSPVALSGALQEIRTILFGAEPDDTMLRLRAFQFLGLLEALGYDGRLDVLDGRKTYDLAAMREGLWRDPRSIGPVVSGGSGALIELTVDPDKRRQARRSAGETGKTEYRWTVERLSGNQVRIEMYRPSSAVLVVEAPVQGNLSGPIELPRASFSARVGGTTGDRWDIEDTLFPSFDIGGLVRRLQQASPEAVAATFQETARPPEDPVLDEERRLFDLVSEFRETWRDRQLEDPFRLGAFVSAWILAVHRKSLSP